MADADAYIANRLTPRRAWYDRRAVLYKKLHLGFQIVGVTGSVLLVLATHFDQIERPVLGAIAAFVTLCLAAERIGKFGELWWTYRLAAEALETEEQLFRHAVGVYTVSEDARAKLLVTRCEQLLSEEALTWMRVVRRHAPDPASGVVVE